MNKKNSTDLRKKIKARLQLKLPIIKGFSVENLRKDFNISNKESRNFSVNPMEKAAVPISIIGKSVKSAADSGSPSFVFNKSQSDQHTSNFFRLKSSKKLLSASTDKRKASKDSLVKKYISEYIKSRKKTPKIKGFQTTKDIKDTFEEFYTRKKSIVQIKDESELKSKNQNSIQFTNIIKKRIWKIRGSLACLENPIKHNNQLN